MRFIDKKTLGVTDTCSYELQAVAYSIENEQNFIKKFTKLTSSLYWRVNFQIESKFYVDRFGDVVRFECKLMKPIWF